MAGNSQLINVILWQKCDVAIAISRNCFETLTCPLNQFINSKGERVKEREEKENAGSLTKQASFASEISRYLVYLYIYYISRYLVS